MKKQNNYMDFTDDWKSSKFGKYIGLQITTKESKIRTSIGLAILGIALFPNGLGVIFYPLSFAMLGISMIDIKQKTREYKRIIKNKLLRGC